MATITGVPTAAPVDQIVKLSHKLVPIGLTEGTFAPWQHQVLLKINCHSLQGYLDGSAQPSEFLMDAYGNQVSNQDYNVFRQ